MSKLINCGLQELLGCYMAENRELKNVIIKLEKELEEIKNGESEKN